MLWRPTNSPEPGGRAAPEPPGEGRKVFAHYFPPYPISIDNQPAANDYYSRNYLTIEGESGKHASYGGWLRDRPPARSPISDPDWRVQDLRTEVRQAKAAGIDGFTVNILSPSGTNWTASLDLMRAAADVGGFTVVPNVDATASIASQTPAATASGLAQLYEYSSAAKVDGEYLLSSFAAERKSTRWWQQVINRLEQDHDVPIKFIAVFLDASDANLQTFAPMSYGFGNWGVRSPDKVRGAPNYAARAHALGRKWMEPVAFQDSRPRSGTYAEAGNTETGRATWTKAIEDHADYVQVVTWNDYSESTHIAPSMAHGSVLLDISAYYIDWFRNGKPPAIDADHLYLTHRIHRYAASATSGIDNMASTLGGSSTPPRDTVEALAFLTSPARVKVSSGGSTRTFKADAGLSTFTVPLVPGAVSGEIVRNSTVVVSVVSPHTVTASPVVQDFQYFAAGE
jgi:hypothetical protein